MTVAAMTAPALVALYSVMWAGFGVVSGWIAAHLPDRWFAGDTVVTRIRPGEDTGGWYSRHLRVRAWKDRLPEAGALFGGRSKASMSGTSPSQLSTMAAETRRAEWVHWANVAFGWTFLGWQPWTVGVVMVLFGAMVHLPFVVVQRFNRARLEHLIELRTRRLHPA